MDRSQLLNDSEEALRLALDGRQATIWTAIPGIVLSVDLSEMTCSVQPTIQGVIENENQVRTYVDLPVLIHVPIVFPSVSGFAMTMPLVAGDEVLVVFSARCIDAWWQSGGVQKPMEARMHDLSDGFAFPARMSQAKKLANVSSTKLQLRNVGGTVVFGFNTKFRMENAATDLKTVLSDLQSLLNTFMGVLAAFGGGVAPVTQAMLQAPATTAVTQLTALLVKIDALLE